MRKITLFPPKNQFDLLLLSLRKEWKQLWLLELRTFKKNELEIIWRKAFDLSNRLIELTIDPFFAEKTEANSLLQTVLKFADKIFQKVSPTAITLKQRISFFVERSIGICFDAYRELFPSSKSVLA